jgi:hypothetical protein
MTSRSGRCRGTWLAILFALAGADAEARADGRTILRVRSPKGALEERVASELSALGFDVDDVEPKDPDADLGAIARAYGARAAIRVHGDDAIELWTSAPQEPGPPISETIRIDPRLGWNLAAVSALEVLRAHLLAVPPSPPPAPAAAGAAPPSALDAPAPAIVAPKATRLWMQLAGGAEVSPGGLGPTPAILGEVRFEPQPWLGVGLFGVVPPVASAIQGPEGVASVRAWMIGAAGDAQMRAGAITASAGLGAVVAMFSFDARPAPGYGAESASIVTAGPVLRSCAAIEITRALRLRAGLLGGLTFPHAVIHFAGRAVADWGRPVGLLTLGLEWSVQP